ncbi:unnamed protein product [Effrenium voratum]|uniref:PROP1-like PPR domain-containing protein n=1 Tax=Effrenium voratum TaxID=2562239 RepID=A0AA36JJL8_9DINO|nr:unnamed protein product [Effrenium voratum]CAJ1428033.1 unnamed protein product [Effrenium voratum]
MDLCLPNSPSPALRGGAVPSRRLGRAIFADQRRFSRLACPVLAGGVALAGRRSSSGRAAASAVVPTQEALQKELAEWGDDDEEPEIGAPKWARSGKGRSRGERGPRSKVTEDASLEDVDWQRWVTAPNKEKVWKVLKDGKPDQDSWKKVILSLRRGDCLDTKEEYARALEILASRHQGWRDATVILSCMWFNGFKPEGSHYAWVMRALIKSSRWNQTIQLFEEMVEHGIAPDEYCYTFAINAYSRKREVEGSLQLLQAMKADGLRPQRRAYHVILYALGQIGAWMQSLEIMDDMVKQGVMPVAQTFNLLVMAYGNAGEIEGVVQTIDYMRTTKLELSLGTFLYGMRAAERAGELDQGLLLFQKMRTLGIKTSEKVDEVLMSIAITAGDPDRALQFFDAAMQRRQQWGRVEGTAVAEELGIYRQALRACEMGAASGLRPGGIPSYEDYALQLLLELQKSKLPLDSTMYLHAVSACEYNKSWLRVVSLLKEMKEKGIKVEGERFRSAFQNGIMAAQEDENPDEAFDLFQQMKANKLTVETDMYQKMIQMLEMHGQLARATNLDTELADLQLKSFNKELMVHRKRNEWQEAVAVLQKVRDEGIMPTLKFTNTALSALQKPGKWEMVLDLLGEMKKDGQPPDACSFTVLVSAMLQAGELQKAVAQLKNMEKQGVHPTYMTYGRLIHALEAAGQPEQALYLWDEMRQKHVEPDRVAYEAAIRACRASEFWEALLELFSEMKELDKGPSKASTVSAALAAERLGLAESVVEGAEPALTSRDARESFS